MSTPETPEPDITGQDRPEQETTQPPVASPRLPRDDPWSEKGEKSEGEKEEEKTREKEEKPRDVSEKWRQDPLSAIVAAACLIVGGLVLILDNLNVPVFRGHGWNIAITFAGLIVALGAMVRLMVPEYRRPIRGSLILAAVLVGIGLSGWIGSGVVWALAIIGVGTYILVKGLRRGM